MFLFSLELSKFELDLNRVLLDIGRDILTESKKLSSFFLSSVETVVVPSVSLFTLSDGKVLSSEDSEFWFKLSW